MQIIKTDPFHPQIEAFEAMCKKEWPEYFEPDFGGPHIRCLSDPLDAEIYLITENDQILGGAVINTNLIINYYDDPAKEDRARELRDTGIQNFTYFVVDQSQQGRGLGSQLLEYIKTNHPKIWIKPELDKVEFYEKRGFIIDMPGDEKDEYPIMIRIQ